MLIIMVIMVVVVVVDNNSLEIAIVHRWKTLKITNLTNRIIRTGTRVAKFTS